jgi:hypothetical protein
LHPYPSARMFRATGVSTFIRDGAIVRHFADLFKHSFHPTPYRR